MSAYQDAVRELAQETGLDARELAEAIEQAGLTGELVERMDQ